MAELRIGTCSWKYDSWKGLIYPESSKINFLKEYTAHYNTVEIDQWFWSLHANGKIALPKRNVVEIYNSSTPEDFKFTIKTPNSITLTHPYSKSKNSLGNPNEYFLSCNLFKTFLETLESIKSKIGMLMFQFEYLNKQKMRSLFYFEGLFSTFIKNCPENFNYAMEIRNPNYLNESYFRFLNENNLHHVFAEGYYMPKIFNVYEKYRDFIKNKTVIRLLGPNRKGIEQKTEGKWNKIIEPKDTELMQIVKMIKDLLSRELDVYLNVNNHYEGSAPLTIKKINNLLEQF